MGRFSCSLASLHGGKKRENDTEREREQGGLSAMKFDSDP